MRRRLALAGTVLALVGGVLVAPAGAGDPGGGDGGGGKDDGSATISTPAERAERQAGLELLTLIPSSYDSDCVILTDEDVAADTLLAPLESRLLAGINCVTEDGTIGVNAFKFDGEDAVNALYDAYTPQGLNSGAPGCETDSTWGDGRGRYKCYPGESGAAAVVWTLPEANTSFSAFGTDPDVAALVAWWETDAPPIDDPPEPGELVSDKKWEANSLILGRSVPKNVGLCTMPSINEDDLGRTLYRSRMYLRTVLFCEPGAGITTYFLADFQTRASAQGYLDSFLGEVDEETPRVEFEGTDCEGTGTWSRGPGRRVAGDYVCYFADDGAVFIIWTDKKQGVAVVAGREDGDAEKLLEFYAKEAGPRPNPALSG